MAGGADKVELLVDLGLLERTGEDRYTLHQAIHDYASTDGPTAQARERLVCHYVAVLEAAAAIAADAASRGAGTSTVDAPGAVDWSADTINVQGPAAGDDQHIEMTFRSDP